jgi:hypothetical protein
MKSKLTKEIAEPIILGITSECGDHTTKEIVKSIDSRLPGFNDLYKEFKKNQLEQAIPKIKELADEMSVIVDPVNKTVCSDCPRYKESKAPSDWGVKNLGCCECCWESNGHFNRSDNCTTLQYRKEIGILKDTHGWNHLTGFLSNKGCMLPREKRSCTCLGHFCSSLRSALTKEQNDRINIIIKEIKDLRIIAKTPLY